ncbi:MAG TPA: NADH-quinone oxidoreductase subunit M, partial [Gemmataceae bacterium]|nr:NADH-quinone oxidoreductase subunit M [Gemmataceae bacterium]
MFPYEYEWDFIWMTLVVFVPSVFALGLLFFPRGKDEAMRWWSLIGTALTLGLSIGMFWNFRYDTVESHGVLDTAQARYDASLPGRAEKADNPNLGAPARSRDWVARYSWIKSFHIDYYLGADGISMALILLTTALSFLAMIASWKIEKFVRGYCILFLVLETGMLGTFLALDFFLFYIFWEVMLLPMYFLIGVWGGPRREYAAIKFFLYTLLGSVFILIALLAFYFTNVRDFVTPQLLEAAVADRGGADVAKARDAVKAAETNQANVEQATRKAVQQWEAARQELENNSAPADKEPKAPEQANPKKPAEVDKAVQDAYNDALKKRTAAARELLVARVKRTTALLQVKDLTVNTFDLVLLQRVGKAAQEHLHEHDDQVSTPIIDEAKSLESEMKDAKNGWSDKDRAAAAAYAAAAETGMKERLSSQSFFSAGFQYTMFLFLFIGFAIKVPVFPFHTWLPDAHVEAPTPISMILAGVLLKMGGYGIIRIAYPICPWAAESLAFWIALFGIINIVYGAFAAMAQTDFKKLVAYSSVSHMGYVILGVAVWSTGPGTAYWAWGMNGAVFQMIAHGITSAGMFFLVGVIYDRAHHRNLDNFRGLYEPMPLYGGISAVIFFAAMGLPGMCGFVGEFMVVLSAWNFAPGGHQAVGIVFSVLAAATVVLTAAYILWTIQRVFMGQNPAYKNFKDMDYREVIAAVPLVVLAVLFGVAPP